MTLLYRLIYQMVLLLLRLLYWVTPKLKAGYLLRQPSEGVLPWLKERTLTRPIWIHCASGEFEYAVPLIRTIKQKNPQQKIIVTYFTPSYVKRIQQEPLVDLVMPSPWDTPHHIKEFIKFHQPRALLFARTDVWHEMSYQCHRYKIPVTVFSMTFSKSLSGLALGVQKWLFKYIDHFFVVSAHDKENLKKVVSEDKISVVGDTRYEQCLHRLSLHLPLKINASLIQKKVFIAGSTWTEDEQVLLPTIAKNMDLCHWIIVPHEVDGKHIAALKEQLQLHRLKPVLYSQIDTWDMQGVLIVDTVGVLAHLYKLADLSFVGGSFKKQVHSVMESLACGCLTFVGPHYKNNREAIEFSQIDAGFPIPPVQVCEAQDFEEKVHLGLKTWSVTQSDRLKSLVESKARVSEPLYNELLKQF